MDLPDELLHDVLRRVPPRQLAACRRVRKSWRAVIDGRGLVTAHLAPGPVRSMFLNFTDKRTHGFFSRSGASAAAAEPPPSVDGSLLFLPEASSSRARARVWDHCNGLLLYQNSSRADLYVCNPATRRWARLPRRPPRPDAGPRYFRDRLHLVFDPAVSLRYRVVFFPEVPGTPTRQTPAPSHGKRPRDDCCVDGEIQILPAASRPYDYEEEVEKVGSMEWPPPSYALQVFSSETGLWEERCFVRQGEAVTTVSEVWSKTPRSSPACGRALRCYAGVYSQGAFYLNWPGGFIMRFSLLEEKYTVIKTPGLTYTFFGQQGKRIGTPNVYLAKSKQGIYYTLLLGYQLQIWILHGASESCQTPEWELKHQVDLKSIFSRHYTTGEEIDMSWILNPGEELPNDGGDHGWDSSDDCTVVDAEEGTRNKEASTEHDYGVDLLGYHPYREIVFLGNRYNGFAYYLGSSKLQYLGRLYPTCLDDFEHTVIAYIYTPCNDDLLPAQNDA